MLIERPHRHMKMNSKATEAQQYVVFERKYKNNRIFSSSSSYDGPFVDQQHSKPNKETYFPTQMTNFKSDMISHGTGTIFEPDALIESPSVHRYSSGLSHLIQNANIPAGSTIGNSGGARQFTTPAKVSSTSMNADPNSIV